MQQHMDQHLVRALGWAGVGVGVVTRLDDAHRSAAQPARPRCARAWWF